MRSLSLQDGAEDSGGVVHMVVRVGPSRQGEPHELEMGKAVLPRIGVAVGQDGADLDAAQAALDKGLDAEGLGDEFLAGEEGQEAAGVDEDGVAAIGAAAPGRRSPRASLRSAPPERSGLEVVELGRLAQAHREGA